MIRPGVVLMTLTCQIMGISQASGKSSTLENVVVLGKITQWKEPLKYYESKAMASIVTNHCFIVKFQWGSETHKSFSIFTLFFIIYFIINSSNIQIYFEIYVKCLLPKKKII